MNHTINYTILRSICQCGSSQFTFCSCIKKSMRLTFLILCGCLENNAGGRSVVRKQPLPRDTPAKVYRTAYPVNDAARKRCFSHPSRDVSRVDIMTLGQTIGYRLSLRLRDRIPHGRELRKNRHPGGSRLPRECKTYQV